MSGASGATGAVNPVPYSIIAPTSPLVDVRTGRITREWYRFLLSLFITGGGGQPQPTPASLASATADLARLTAAETMPVRGPDYANAIADLQRQIATQPDQDGHVAAMRQQIADLQIEVTQAQARANSGGAAAATPATSNAFLLAAACLQMVRG